MQDIVLFHFYSSPPMPDCCYLGMRPDIAYRNMLLLPCEEKRIHFELPFFEDHSYNTICNRKGVMSLIKRPHAHEKYVIFKTTNKVTGERSLVGYFRVGQAYYQESKVFDNNGYVWGFDASESHLVRMGDIKFTEERLGRNYLTSWNMNERVLPLLDWSLRQIRSRQNLAETYQKETNRLIALLKDERQVAEWRKHCVSCMARKQCRVFRYYTKVGKDRLGCDMYTAVNRVYNGTVYSRNLLSKMRRIPIRGGE